MNNEEIVEIIKELQKILNEIQEVEQLLTQTLYPQQKQKFHAEPS